MGEPINGRWRRVRQVPYVSAAKWGTGVDLIHYQYGGPSERVHGRNGNEPDVTPVNTGHGGFVELNYPWGVQESDAQPYPYDAISFVQDGHPSVGTSTTQFRSSDVRQPPWNAPGPAKARFRAIWGGAHDEGYKTGNQIPDETVSEGWINKPTGAAADSEPSDPSQYEMQTSMTQRYKTRVNTAAVNRNTDGARSAIASRVVGQKLKIYSGQDRHYDMFPYQQRQINRPFWYRTFATGPQSYMPANEVSFNDPIQRTPPPDPSLGVTDSSLDYGYTGEDQFYA